MSLYDIVTYFSTLNAFLNPFALEFSEVKDFRKDDKYIRRVIRSTLKNQSLNLIKFKNILKIIKIRLNTNLFEKLDPLYAYLLWKLINILLEYASMDNILEPFMEEEKEIKRFFKDKPLNEISLKKIRKKMGLLDFQIIKILCTISNPNDEYEIMLKYELIKFISWSKWHVDNYSGWKTNHFNELIDLFNNLLNIEYENSFHEEYRINVLNQILKLISLEIESPLEMLPEDESILNIVYRNGKQFFNGHSFNSFGFSKSERVRKYKKLKKVSSSINLEKFVRLVTDYSQDSSCILNTYCLPVLEMSMMSECTEKLIYKNDSLLDYLFDLSSLNKLVGENILNVFSNVKKWRNLQFSGLKSMISIVAWPINLIIWKDIPLKDEENKLILKGLSKFKEPIYSVHDILGAAMILGIRKEMLDKLTNSIVCNVENNIDNNQEIKLKQLNNDNIQNYSNDNLEKIKEDMKNKFSPIISGFNPNSNGLDINTPSLSRFFQDKSYHETYKMLMKRKKNKDQNQIQRRSKIISQNRHSKIYRYSKRHSNYLNAHNSASLHRISSIIPEEEDSIRKNQEFDYSNIKIDDSKQIEKIYSHNSSKINLDSIIYKPNLIHSNQDFEHVTEIDSNEKIEYLGNDTPIAPSTLKKYDDSIFDEISYVEEVL